MSYAKDTSVPIDRTQGEIKKCLLKYGATGFAFGEQKRSALILFELHGRRIKFILPLAVYMETRNEKGTYLGENHIAKENRRRWRCLLLAIKAKVECVESGITTLENEFMANVVLPNGQTVGEVMAPQIEHSYRNQEMPPLLGFDGGGQ